MKKIKNWDKFNNRSFKLTDDKIRKGDYFIFNDDGRIRKCNKESDGIGVGKFINYSFNDDFCKKVEFDDNISMEPFDETKNPVIKITPPNLKCGDDIYFLYDYTLERGVVKSIGRVNVKITHSFGGIKDLTIPFDKVAEPDEKICVVWEQWKGGEGGYRLERDLYSKYRIPAKNYPYQKYIYEDSYESSCDNNF